jgi:hypothetical protein
MRTLASVALLAAACGSSSSKQADAPQGDAIHVDTIFSPDDAPPDSPPSMGNHAHYVVDSVTVPTNTAQAHQYGLDLNNDGTVDNKLGGVLAVFGGMGFDPQPSVNDAVNKGQILMLADLQTTDFTTATAAGFTLYIGQNPHPAPCSSSTDTTCRHHLQGTGTFDAAASPRDSALVGDIASGTLLTTTTNGKLPVQVSFGGPPLTVELVGARAKVSATSTHITAGIIAGGVTVDDLNSKVFPALQTVLMTAVTNDCTHLTTPPTCGCASGSQGEKIIGTFDANHDCMVSTAEITGNTLIQALFSPDLVIGGKQAISVGLGFTAVPGTYTP